MSASIRSKTSFNARITSGVNRRRLSNAVVEFEFEFEPGLFFVFVFEPGKEGRYAPSGL